MPEAPPRLAGRSRRLLRQWARKWGLPGFESAVSVTLTTRLRRSLGRCRPARGAIALRHDLTRVPAATFDAVLCHEAAHVAAYLLHGRTVRAHGPEWSALVAAAGFNPAARMVAPSAQPPRRPRSGYRYEHRCPVCQSARLARRTMTGWRCAECVEAGLEGVMEIRPHPFGAAGR